MGWRFQKRITIFPGFRLNLSRRGISTSIGPRGASLTVHKHGVDANVGLPGSGLSYRERIARWPKQRRSSPWSDAPAPAPVRPRKGFFFFWLGALAWLVAIAVLVL